MVAAGLYLGSSSLALVRLVSPSPFSFDSVNHFPTVSVYDPTISVWAVSCQIFFVVFFLWGFVRHLQQKISLERATHSFPGLLFGFVRHLQQWISVAKGDTFSVFIINLGHMVRSTEFSLQFVYL